MKHPSPASSLANHVLDLAAQCFDASTLNALAKLRLTPKLAARVDRLADKANEGQLTLDERATYDELRAAFHLITRLQAKARSFLSQ